MVTPRLTPDGPHDQANTLAVASLMADAARILCYATMPGNDGLEHATDVYEVIASLKIAAERLPQALRQCGEFLEAQARDGKLGDTEGRVPDRAASITAGRLEQSAHHAGEMAKELARAQSEMSGLYSLEGGDL